MKLLRFAPLLLAAMVVALPQLALAQQAAAPKAPAAAKPAPVPAGPKESVTPVPRPGNWMQRHELINSRAVPGQVDVIFLGDSITQGWEGSGKDAWAKHFGSLKPMNAGIGGDRTEHVLWRLDHGNLDGLKPKLIVMMIGTNNTGHRQDKSEDTAAGVKAIVEKVQAKCPEAKILLLAIFPRGEKADDPLRKLNDGANALIKKLADDKKVFFKDISAEFVEKDGTLKREIMPDLLHLNAKGYAAWAAAIKDDVEKLMRD